MKKIAVLLTCFNRKEKTISALRRLYNAKKNHKSIALTVYLTDDGSTDGTTIAVQVNFPEVIILKGNGELFWAGGMINSWQQAIKGEYDSYFLLNDDTNVFPEVFDELLTTHENCIKKYGVPGIYIGSTQDAQTGELTYGGAVFLNRFLFKFKFLQPNGQVQLCELGNANIMLVPKEVVNQIGILSKGYKHGVADYDYTLKALKKEIPILVAPNYCGSCSDDHTDIYTSFPNKTFQERLQILRHPLGLDFNSNLLLMKQHFPLRVPGVILAAALKLILPSLYVKSRGKA